MIEYVSGSLAQGVLGRYCCSASQVQPDSWGMLNRPRRLKQFDYRTSRYSPIWSTCWVWKFHLNVHQYFHPSKYKNWEAKILGRNLDQSQKGQNLGRHMTKLSLATCPTHGQMMGFLRRPVPSRYRSPRLQWHCLQWHPAYSDTFGMSQMIGLLLSYLWLQWQSGYSGTCPMSPGCHCKRGPLYQHGPRLADRKEKVIKKN